MLAPIPRIMLKETINYSKRTGVDEYAKEVFDSSVEIEFVKIEPVKESSLRSLGEMKNDKLKLWYDYVNSVPNNIVFSEKDKITFNGVDYTVRSVSDYINHHAEVMLT